jgi:hypothetical protein
MIFAVISPNDEILTGPDYSGGISLTNQQFHRFVTGDY